MLRLAGGDFPDSHSPYSNEIDAGFARARSSRTMLLTCLDAVMDPVLEHVLQFDSIIASRHAGALLNSQLALHEQVRLDIDFALEHLEVGEIWVCGHSFCSNVAVAERIRGNCHAMTGYAGIVDWVRERETRNRLARAQVVRQLEAVEAYLDQSHPAPGCPATVEGLFYLMESGIFTRYDRDLEQFVPIEASTD